MQYEVLNCMLHGSGTFSLSQMDKYPAGLIWLRQTYRLWIIQVMGFCFLNKQKPLRTRLQTIWVISNSKKFLIRVTCLHSILWLSRHIFIKSRAWVKNLSISMMTKGKGFSLVKLVLKLYVFGKYKAPMTVWHDQFASTIFGPKKRDIKYFKVISLVTGIQKSAARSVFQLKWWTEYATKIVIH